VSRAIEVRRNNMNWRIWLLTVGLCGCSGALAAEPPSRPGIDAPELAHLGPFAVGVRLVKLVQHDQPNVLKFDPGKGVAPREDRTLLVDVWYPAAQVLDAVADTYRASLPSEPPAPPAEFSIPALAFRDAPADPGQHPLVIVSHGYSNATFALSWLTENLASKGYVVAAIRHEDPPITERSAFPQPWLRRPLDIAFVARELTRSGVADPRVDPTRIALIGYSMGGYGVLTGAGATIDPSGPVAAKLVPGGLLLPYARGGSARDSVIVANVRGVVAISPAGGGKLPAWGDGVADVHVPLLLISGDSDRTVDYQSGALAFFNATKRAPRYLLTFKGGGHALGLNSAPEAMRGRLWDLDWFEDPVWRKERIIAINLHFITAFLDRFVKGDESRAEYLDGLVVESAAGQWPADNTAQYAAFSPGGDGITVWKGFQRNHALGLELRHSAAEPVGN
jgi:predicted dienelactone hydrolase